MASFRTRLILGLTVIPVALVLATGVFTYFEQVSSIDHLIDQGLTTMAETQRLTQSENAAIRSDNSTPTVIQVSGLEGYNKVAWIETRNGKRVARNANLDPSWALVEDPKARRMALGGTTCLGPLTIRGASFGAVSFRAAYFPVTNPATFQRMVGVVGASLGPRNASANALGVTLAIVIAATTFGGGALGLLYARRVVEPLKALATMAQTIHEAPRGTRVSAGSTDRELMELAGAINAGVEGLEEAIEQKDRLIAAQNAFFSDASHELRNPVANILGTAEITLRRPRSEGEYRQALETVHSEVGRLTQLVNDLLLLARSDSGHFPLDVTQVDLLTLCQESIAAFSAAATANGVDLSVQGRRTFLTADARRLRQAVDNLISNALRYAKKKAWIRVTEGCIRVSNDGPPIPASAVPKLFDRFFRAEEARSRDGGGTGLGLAIVAAIADAHGGSVRLVTREPVTFEIVLPTYV